VKNLGTKHNTKMDNKNELGKEFALFLKKDFKMDIESIVHIAHPQMNHDKKVPIIESMARNIPGYTPMDMTPSVIEERQLNVTAISVFDRLMMERIIFLGMPINDQVANIVIAQLLFLNSVDQNKAVELYINSPGGSVYAGLGIYDTMHYVDCDIATTCTGLAASMAYVLAVSGTKGKRASLPNSRYMQHQPLGGAYGQASDIEITHNEIQFLKKRLYAIIAAKTGQSFEQVQKDCDRDHWMSPMEAKAYGCIDEVMPNNDGVEY
jgi:ATP-dependent Clp protease protease subunit